jgi:hypothetical protein
MQELISAHHVVETHIHTYMLNEGSGKCMDCEFVVNANRISAKYIGLIFLSIRCLREMPAENLQPCKSRPIFFRSFCVCRMRIRFSSKCCSDRLWTCTDHYYWSSCMRCRTGVRCHHQEVCEVQSGIFKAIFFWLLHSLSARILRPKYWSGELLWLPLWGISESWQKWMYIVPRFILRGSIPSRCLPVHKL